MPHLMVVGFAPKGQTGTANLPWRGLLEGTLLLSDLGLAHVGKKTGVGGAAEGKVLARLFQAHLAVDREPDFSGVFVLLAVIFPPADRAQPQRPGCCERPIAATRATKSSAFAFHPRMDGIYAGRVYSASRPKLAQIAPDSRKPPYFQGADAAMTPASCLGRLGRRLSSRTQAGTHPAQDRIAAEESSPCPDSFPSPPVCATACSRPS